MKDGGDEKGSVMSLQLIDTVKKSGNCYLCVLSAAESLVIL